MAGLAKIFKQMDEDASGELEFEEVSRGLTQCGMNWPDGDLADVFMVRA